MKIIKCSVHCSCGHCSCCFSNIFCFKFLFVSLTLSETIVDRVSSCFVIQKLNIESARKRFLACGAKRNGVSFESREMSNYSITSW